MSNSRRLLEASYLARLAFEKTGDESHEGKNWNALFDLVRLSDALVEPLPHWAVAELADVYAKYSAGLAGKSLNIPVVPFEAARRNAVRLVDVKVDKDTRQSMPIFRAVPFLVDRYVNKAGIKQVAAKYQAADDLGISRGMADRYYTYRKKYEEWFGIEIWNWFEDFDDMLAMVRAMDDEALSSMAQLRANKIHFD